MTLRATDRFPGIDPPATTQEMFMEKIRFGMSEPLRTAAQRIEGSTADQILRMVLFAAGGVLILVAILESRRRSRN